MTQSQGHVTCSSSGHVTWHLKDAAAAATAELERREGEQKNLAIYNRAFPEQTTRLFRYYIENCLY